MQLCFCSWWSWFWWWGVDSVTTLFIINRIKTLEEKENATTAAWKRRLVGQAFFPFNKWLTKAITLEIILIWDLYTKSIHLLGSHPSEPVNLALLPRCAIHKTYQSHRKQLTKPCAHSCICQTTTKNTKSLNDGLKIMFLITKEKC